MPFCQRFRYLFRMIINYVLCIIFVALNLNNMNDTIKNQAKQEFVENTAFVLVQHLKNALEVRKKIGQKVGMHSRFMENMVHPEDFFLLCGESQEVKDGHPKHREHIVPCVVLLNQSIDLIRKGKDLKYIAQLFAKHWKVAYISKAQQSHLDGKLGLRTSMPQGWDFENGDTFARLKSAGIELLPI